MPASGPVYQPTTVSYEQQNDWTTGYLSQTINSGVNRTRCIQWMILTTGVFILGAGLIMTIAGAVNYRYAQEINTPDADPTGELVIAIAGAFMIAAGVCVLFAYLRMIRRRKGFPCFLTKDQRLARQLRETQMQNGQILTLGPSTTDLLVTAQYGPVSEIAYQPPAVTEEEETRELMGSENKECVEESERMLEADPRIVLRPLSHVDEH